MQQINEWLEKSGAGRQKCTICGRRIPADIERISFAIVGQQSTVYKRICGLCIIRLARAIDKKPVNEWAKKVAAEEL